MPEISFNCPECRQAVEAPEEMAGQTAVCPGCGHKITVPLMPEPEPQILFIGQEDAESHVESSADDVVREDCPKCPACGADMEIGAVLCIACGFHTVLGKKMTTDWS